MEIYCFCGGGAEINCYEYTDDLSYLEEEEEEPCSLTHLQQDGGTKDRVPLKLFVRYQNEFS